MTTTEEYALSETDRALLPSDEAHEFFTTSRVLDDACQAAEYLRKNLSDGP